MATQDTPAPRERAVPGEAVWAYVAAIRPHPLSDGSRSEWFEHLMRLRSRGGWVYRRPTAEEEDRGFRERQRRA